jgi:hypothetical protein
VAFTQHPYHHENLGKTAKSFSAAAARFRGFADAISLFAES